MRLPVTRLAAVAAVMTRGCRSYRGSLSGGSVMSISLRE